MGCRADIHLLLWVKLGRDLRERVSCGRSLSLDLGQAIVDHRVGWDRRVFDDPYLELPLACLILSHRLRVAWDDHRDRWRMKDYRRMRLGFQCILGHPLLMPFEVGLQEDRGSIGCCLSWLSYFFVVRWGIHLYQAGAVMVLESQNVHTPYLMHCP